VIGGPWFVWAPGRQPAVVQTAELGVVHCKAIANDHRSKVELLWPSPNICRYVGPRGRRHGTRLVAFIVTADGAGLLGLDLDLLRLALEARGA
jgi:hypothetical protein